MTQLTAEHRPRRSGEIAFLAGSVSVHGGNYVFNLFAVRTLDPAQYADIALAVSLLLLSGFVTVGLQMATARSVAAAPESEGEPMARWFHRRAYHLGVALGAGLAVASPLLAQLFNTQGPLPLLAVAAALPWAMTAGVGRGLQQGLARFGRLAVSFQAEMLVRLLMGAGLMAAGYGVAGGVGALTASVIAAALVVRVPAGPVSQLDTATRKRLVAALSPSIAMLVGEALVNHADTIIAKQAFDPVAAGQFAAIALIGRSVFFVTWPVSMLVFPTAAARAARGEPTGRLLVGALAAVSAIGAVAVVSAAVAPEAVVDLALGADYVAQASLLAPYVAATALFSASTTIVAFAVAVGRNRAAFIALAFGVISTTVLALFHPSLAGLVWAQVALNATGLAAACAWMLRRRESQP